MVRFNTKVLILIALFSGKVYPQSDGPLFVRSQTLAQFFRASPNPEFAKASHPNNISVKASKTWSNYWGRDQRYIVDGQTTDDSFQLRYQMDKNISFGLEASSRSFSSANMDAIAIGFHDAFQIPQDKRIDFERNKIRFVIPDYGLEITGAEVDVPISETIGSKASYHFEMNSNLSLAFGLGVYYELAPRTLHHQGAKDWLLQWSSAYQLPVGLVYGNGNLMIFDDTEDDRVYLKDFQKSLVLGYQLPVPKGLVLLEALLTESPFIDLGMLSRTSYEIHLGYRYSWDELVSEVTLIENIIWPYNTPDWGLSIGLAYIKF